MLLMEHPSIRSDRVRELRMENHLTQQELAVAADLSLGQVNRIEGGKIERPQFRTVRALARVFGVEPDELLISNGNGQAS